MLVIPALDLRGGRLVRLWQGDYQRETVYGDDPVAAARAFAAAGAPRLHVVDLDGARQGRPVHQALIRQLVRAVPVPVQVGGGIRDAATAAAYLEDGAAAVIFGTVAVRQPEVVARVAARYPGRVLASLDLKEGRAAVDGWTAAGEPPAALLERLRAAGVTEVIVTDTGRDGTLAGVDPAVFAPFLRAGFRVIAAGGVRDVHDVVRLQHAGLAGVIAGRALYEGTLDLAAALAAVREAGKAPGLLPGGTPVHEAGQEPGPAPGRDEGRSTRPAPGHGPGDTPRQAAGRGPGDTPHQGLGRNPGEASPEPPGPGGGTPC
ncbi:1-(5-phosphoribosyl)-5-[(5-phosphoribosylamino)methylideneamino]imidazole-4-carboxamide isomerase [Thermaerobacter sp. PB12/4term]|uniref:1-(5-phosphoribosyl)-5-[(5- phosphoribosylamino)methylideneamino]imidazole-4- carboxamide isomerase n=1 Tax=Thermaerobacter sp. PB12/4term TaxID=2293838 RepID=UPI000E326CCF|nr:1-(5-phosphoribosyl)-5-[(5-phosphoribosylamino)methylideneamino]imidazole-4-carboxamide isomerase [Thermaerobacter sp. PB12/4term]QIA26592.1 1-(5-phosphoribosyl)-5-[(5-phosphoribosylamino)methylideneamino]imidazole-4-carboxamide isomerase [Thermaerobacter sp. PB12/4term]